MTPEKVRKIVKTMPVMYLKSQTKSLFINLHEFVLTPGVFKSILLLGKPADAKVKQPRLLLILILLLVMIVVKE